MSAWEDRDNAEQYAAFTRTDPMYVSTSRDVVERAVVPGSSTVVDLCCGTGVTTEAVLARLARAADGGDCRVFAVDGSEAMLAVARREIQDPRVRFVQARIEEVDGHVGGPVDAVVCNSAIWQSELDRTFAAVHRVLRPGGRFAFNIGSRFVDLPDAPRPSSRPDLFHYASAIAVLEYDVVPPAPNRRTGLSTARVEEMLTQVGFSVARTEILEYTQTAEEILAWSLLPVFSRSRWAPLTDDQRRDVFTRAYARVGPTAAYPQRWWVVTAERQ